MQLNDTQQEMIDFQNAGLFDTPIETAPLVSDTSGSDWNLTDIFKTIADPLLAYKKAQLEAETRQKVAQYQAAQKLPTYSRTQIPGGNIFPGSGSPMPQYDPYGNPIQSSALSQMLPFLLIGGAGFIVYMMLKD